MQPRVIYTYFIDNVALDSVDTFINLGVTMDPKLKFSVHIDTIISKANCLLGFIKRWAKEFIYD